MAMNLPSESKARAAATAQGHVLSNPDVADQARYKLALGLPFDATITHDMVLRLAELVIEQDQRLDALEKRG